jgi:structure-specific recognition protein 1
LELSQKSPMEQSQPANIIVTKMEPRSTKGWTWGTYAINPEGIDLSIDQKPGFNLGFGTLQNCFTAGTKEIKNELVMEFGKAETDDPAEATLCEMRLHIPTDAEEINTQILSHTNLSATSGDSLCSIDNIPLVIPRGKYRVNFYDTFLKLHGKTNTYMLLYKNITRTFLLPHADNYHVSFVLNLDSPIR